MLNVTLHYSWLLFLAYLFIHFQTKRTPTHYPWGLTLAFTFHYLVTCITIYFSNVRQNNTLFISFPAWCNPLFFLSIPVSHKIQHCPSFSVISILPLISSGTLKSFRHFPLCLNLTLYSWFIYVPVFPPCLLQLPGDALFYHSPPPPTLYSPFSR